MRDQTISAIVIAKDEENRIADCLDSVSFCDEIIVVDNGSKDRTVEISRRMGAKVFEDNSEDFSELRNFGLQKVTSEWVLYIDADERVSRELMQNIKYRVFNIVDDGISAYKLQRKNFYFGNNPWPYIEHLERFFRKNRLEKWYGKLHESPKVYGKIGDMKGHLLHYTHRNLTVMVNKTLKWSKIEAELRFKSGHPKMNWWRFPRVMLNAFFDSYIRQSGWKVGAVGLIESLYQSFSIFITYARLWEMQENFPSRADYPLGEKIKNEK